MKKKELKRNEAAIHRQVRALRMRVSLLERALRPARRRASQPNELDQKRERAADDARNKALLEFYQQRKIERYLRNPSLLAADLAYEKEVADYLRSRGLEPEASRIPEQFRRGLKKYRPTVKDKV